MGPIVERLSSRADRMFILFKHHRGIRATHGNVVVGLDANGRACVFLSKPIQSPLKLIRKTGCRAWSRVAAKSHGVSAEL